MNRFMADHMLKRSCEWLRLMGYDISYPECHDDNDILKYCIKNNLILLTRDYEFYKRYNKSIFIDSTYYEDQVKEIIGMFPPDRNKFFTRCPVCNSELKDVDSGTMGSNYNTVKSNFKMVKYCEKCNKYFWKGSHYKKIEREINTLMGDM